MSTIIVFFTLLTLSFVYLKVAKFFNIVDKPNHRSSHSVSTVRGGGVLFYFAILLFYFINNFQYPYFVIGITLIAFVSFIDDIKTLTSTIRLPFQFLAIGLCLYQIGISINDLPILLPLLIIGVGFINIYNFMDGINGITGLYSISVLFGLYILNYEVKAIDQNLIIYSIISLIIFGFYNFREKARFFAGDVGSISIAMIIFFIGLSLVIATGSPVIVLLVVVYGADSLLTLIYRKFIGEHITEPHKHHLYQKIVDTLKWSHLKVAITYTILQLLVNVVIYKTYKLDLVTQYLIFIGTVAFFIIIYVVLFKLIDKVRLENNENR